MNARRGVFVALCLGWLVIVLPALACLLGRALW